MKYLAVLLSFLMTLSLSRAFLSLPSHSKNIDTSLYAKHVEKKATEKHMSRRPKKSRPSDINRKVPDYNVEPLRSGDAATIPEYTFCDEENADRHIMDSNYAFVEVAPNTFISKMKSDA